MDYVRLVSTSSSLLGELRGTAEGEAVKEGGSLWKEVLYAQLRNLELYCGWWEATEPIKEDFAVHSGKYELGRQNG
jgi:hypothetical protein